MVEDRVLSQSGVAKVRRVESNTPAAGDGTEFPDMLQSLRDIRGLSKAELAKRTGYDPSTITRFEQGSRAPDRETVLQLAESMVLPLIDRDRLLAAAGFRSVIWDDPMLIELAQVLNDPVTPEDAKAELRTILRMAISYGRQKS